MIREVNFGGIRFAVYEPIKYQLGGTTKADTPVYIKIVAGAAAGKDLAISTNFNCI